MKRNVKLSLSRETLRILTLDGRSLQQAAGGAYTAYNSCAWTDCDCGVAPSTKPGCFYD